MNDTITRDSNCEITRATAEFPRREVIALSPDTLENIRRHPLAFSDLRTEMLEWLRGLPMPSFSSQVALAPSEIAGYGLRARGDIPAGDFVAAETGPRINRVFVQVVEAATGYECNTCVGWGEYLVHAPLHVEGKGGYLNHSCNPNVGMLLDGVWIAIRPILAGEEVTCDYGTFETMRDWNMECACGEAACRKHVSWTDYRDPDLRRRLGRWFAPYLRKQIKPEAA